MNIEIKVRNKKYKKKQSRQHHLDISPQSGQNVLYLLQFLEHLSVRWQPKWER